MLRTTLIVFTLSLGLGLFAQQRQANSAEIMQQLKKINTLGSVLYIAAHPDDENTRLISWLANGMNVRTAYLSLTRGDGGQNLIGTEKGDALGILRTQELLEARKIDGGTQFFSRAVDFGYSKSVEETLEIWDKKKVLADMVRVIRYFKPDVIVTRFPAENYGGHGHHTASAVLAEEAFDMAGDPDAFPKQVEELGTWQPKRLYFNSSSWWDKELPEKAKDNDDYVIVDIGAYNAALGRSYSEIAGESRSQHKSQGFGAARPRGEKLEYLKYVKGEKALDNDLFSGIDMTWERIDNSYEVQELLEEAVQEFDASMPSRSVRELLLALEQLEQLDNEHWRKIKKQEIQKTILACYGIWLEAIAEQPTLPTNADIKISTSALNRNQWPVELKQVNFDGTSEQVGVQLKYNVPHEIEINTKTPSSISQPYWLVNDHGGLYNIEDLTQIHSAAGPAAMNVEFILSVNDMEIRHSVPVQYRWVDRVDGELYRDLAVTPQASVSLDRSVFISLNLDTVLVNVTCKDLYDGSKGKVVLDIPKNWKVFPSSIDLTLDEGEQQLIQFKVVPNNVGTQGSMTAKFQLGDVTIDQEMVVIDHPHISPQVFFPSAEAKMLSMDLSIKGERLAYVMGSGDDIPASLELMGYTVEQLAPADLNTTDLSIYDAIITGIRAWNTENDLAYVNEALGSYVNSGGHLLIQYNTNRGLVAEQLGPVPFDLGRGRVTKEAAKAEFLFPEHAIFNDPNVITESDMDGWVQERGLYFAEEWDEAFQPLIAWNDPGEDPLKGALIVAEFGEGSVTYTGISFFRQLPAGVPGAYRLFANIVSYGR